MLAIVGVLMGAKEIGDMLGVSRQRVQQLISRPDFPKPYDSLSMGKVWLREDVERWAEARRMRLGDAGEESDESAE